MKNVEKFELVDHGIEHSDYFQGCGVAFTEYDECYTGIGEDYSEALEDAIEQAVTGDAVFTSEQTSEIQDLIDANTTERCADIDSDSTYYHVSIRVKFAK